jgi:nifR3 family TIM-barrel protein
MNDHMATKDNENKNAQDKNFWKHLKRPIMAIAPMANVTDAAFRRMFVECGRPDVFWTEFVSIEGLLSAGKEQLLTDLWFSKEEHPIVAQIFGSKPEQFEEVGRMIRELGFDGVDINMGCPDRGVEKTGAGASLIKNPELAKKVIRALKKGVGDLPVSVKTRIGYKEDQISEWIPALLEEDIAALTVHLRTREEMSDVPAHWDLAPQIVALRDRYAPETLILGNGDIDSLKEAHARAESSGMDGVMVGRGIFGNPWFFSGRTPDVRERLTRLVEHTDLFEKIYKSDKTKREGGLKNFNVMKKHYKSYTTGFADPKAGKELRMKLMEAKNASDVRKIVNQFLDQPSFSTG